MTIDQALQSLNLMVWTALMIALPILLAALLVGLLISLIQVTTQVQEITLSYVPKIVVTALLLIGLGPWMLGRATQFMSQLYAIIPTVGG